MVERLDGVIDGSDVLEQRLLEPRLDAAFALDQFAQPAELDTE